MRERLWYEITQVKHHHCYCTFLIARRRNVLQWFNMVILAFSTTGIMGWAVWSSYPILACLIVSAISFVKLLAPHLIPSEKDIDKLDDVVDFYFDYYNSLEQLWFDFYNGRLTEEAMQNKFFALKNSERDVNKAINRLVKTTNDKLRNRADIETTEYLQRTFT